MNNFISGCSFSFLLCIIAACGGESTVAEGGAGDTSTDAAVDTVLDDADDAVADVADDSEQDVDEDAGTGTDTGADASEDAGDAGDVSTDATVDAPDADRPRIPLADFVPCEDSSDCPNGTGNCITELSFSRETAGTPATISIAELDPDWPASGVCSRDCGTSPEVCASISFAEVPPNIETPYTCMLVALGEAPYPEMDGLPDPASLDPEQQELGVPFAALCVPPLHEMESWPVDFGQLCTSASACSEGSACWLDAPYAEERRDDEAGACVPSCAEGDTCPVGFDCVEISEGVTESGDGGVLSALSGSFCLPLERTFTGCRDADADGFGAGQCNGELSTPHDCDDRRFYVRFEDAAVDDRFPSFCGPAFDVNCNGFPDDSEQLGTSSVLGEGYGYAHCTECNFGCDGEVANGRRECAGGAAAPFCQAVCAIDADGLPTHADCDGDVETGCEVAIDNPGRLFVPDCDGDGAGTRETPVFACGDDITFDRDGTTCAAVPAFKNLGTEEEPDWQETERDCDDENGRRFPGNVEICDGVDNDCSETDGDPGVDDTSRAGEACTADALGVCAQGVFGCPDLTTFEVTYTFDDGALAPFTTTGSADWFIRPASDGTGFSAESGDVDNYGSSLLALTVEMPRSGTVTFDYVVSSEDGYDFLRFFIDDALVESWSGEVSGTFSAELSVGSHVLTWLYAKDISLSEGDDSARVDNILIEAESSTPELCLPGVASTEFCDGLDNDCDGTVDNAGVNPEGGEVPVLSRPDATGPVGAAGDACVGSGLGVCGTGTLFCDTIARELVCEFNTGATPEIVVDEDFSAGIRAPFSSASPAWFVNASGEAQSRDIDDRESTTLVLSLDLTTTAILEAPYRVSSESGYDFLSLYVDAELIERVSGTQAGAFSTLLEAGPHTVEFVYSKDNSASRDEDAGFIDSVRVETVTGVDWPGDGSDTDCDGFDGSLSQAVFVGGPGASDAGRGTQNAPYATLDYALGQAVVPGSRIQQVFLSPGDYILSGQLIVPAQFGIFGMGSSQSTINIAQMCDPDEPSCVGSRNEYRAAIVVDTPTDVRFENLRFSLNGQTAAVGPTAVMACEGGCDRLSLTNIDIDPGAGQPGQPGEIVRGSADSGLPTIRPDNINRATDSVRRPEKRCDFTDGSIEYRYGGFMGNRGDRSYRQPIVEDRFYPGMSFGGAGGAGDNGAGGAGGIRAINAAIRTYCTNLSSTACNVSSTPVPGDPTTTYAAQAEGTAGGVGASATSPRPPVANPSSSPWVAADGLRGNRGVSGQSGGGGGGTGTISAREDFGCGAFLAYDCEYRYLRVGQFGESGATGGCGGSGGEAGGAGGTVIGLVVRGASFPSVDAVQIDASSGGAGGRGGAGQAGGAGGARAMGDDIQADYLDRTAMPSVSGNYGSTEPNNGSPTTAYNNTLVTTAGRGGVGGAGGHGAGGTGGNGGWSIGVLTYGPTVPVGVDAELNVTPPTQAAAGGSGGSGVTRSDGDPRSASAIGLPGNPGRSCQIWNAAEGFEGERGTTCVDP